MCAIPLTSDAERDDVDELMKDPDFLKLTDLEKAAFTRKVRTPDT